MRLIPELAEGRQRERGADHSGGVSPPVMHDADADAELHHYQWPGLARHRSFAIDCLLVSRRRPSTA
ncbi:MAG TPA: hypothetical protein VGL63_02985 [Streptosporangiaceae bacterium]|jgi:hypothetical protein